jgi:tetratricopeptide (TPR) repeat protein
MDNYENWEAVLNNLAHRIAENQTDFDAALVIVKQIQFQEQLDAETLSASLADAHLQAHQADPRIFIKSRLLYAAVRHRYESSGGKALSQGFLGVFGYFLAELHQKKGELLQAKKLYERHIDHFNMFMSQPAMPDKKLVLEMNPLRDYYLAGLNNLGQIYAHMNEPEKAVQHCKRVIDIATEKQFFWPITIACNTMGLMHMDAENYSEAAVLFEKGLDVLNMFIERDDKTIRVLSFKMYESNFVKGRLLGNLATSYAHLNEIEKAENFFGQSIDMAEKAGDKQGKADRLGNFGLLLVNQGLIAMKKGAAHIAEQFFKKGIDRYNEAIDISRTVGDRQGEEISLGNRGLAKLCLNRFQGALTDFETALEIARAIEHKVGEANWLSNAGKAAYYLDNFQQGLNDNMKALRLFKEIGFESGRKDALNFLIFILDQNGDKKKADKLRKEL